MANPRPATRAELAAVFKAYDRRTSSNMAAARRAGSRVRTPVRKVSEASSKDRTDRARFIARKARQILAQKQPLKRTARSPVNGERITVPTPAAMQFKRWAVKVPETLEQVRALLNRFKR